MLINVSRETGRVKKMRIEDEELLKIAEDRIKNTNLEETVSEEYVLKKYNISENEINDLAKNIEIE